MPDCDKVAADVFQIESALKAVDFNMMERVAGLRHKAVLHPLTSARKVDLCRWVRRLQGAGDGQRRVDMTGGAAGSN